MLFYDEQLSLRLAKQVGTPNPEALILIRAKRLPVLELAASGSAWTHGLLSTDLASIIWHGLMAVLAVVTTQLCPRLVQPHRPERSSQGRFFLLSGSRNDAAC